jgi:hypothetical protein
MRLSVNIQLLKNGGLHFHQLDGSYESQNVKNKQELTIILHYLCLLVGLPQKTCNKFKDQHTASLKWGSCFLLAKQCLQAT